MSFKEVEDVLDPKQRQENMTAILTALNPDQTEFSTMLLGFADIVQSTFFAYLSSQQKSDASREEAERRINETVNEIMQILNKRSLSNPEDMIVLSTIMIEAVSKSFVRQVDNGIRVSRQLEGIKKQAR